MKTIVLDDDPTGTQSASNVEVLLDFDNDIITDTLKAADSVYIQTNSRAIDEPSARRLAARIREEGLEAGRRLNETIRFVLRGDSTLRGHVFSETEQFIGDRAVMVFVPAFPDGGRTTLAGVHYVRINGTDVPADRSEYARDPVFPFSTAVLVDYVKEKSGRRAVSVALEAVRNGHGLVDELAAASPGDVIVPDALTNEDISLIARQIRTAEGQGADVVVRCASTLAAELAGVTSGEPLVPPFTRGSARTLLICGSHTAGASRQLARIESLSVPCTIDTESALRDSSATGLAVANRLRQLLNEQGLAILASDRHRLATHNTLQHGERIMATLTAAVRELRCDVEVVISKGGITSAEVARTGLGASRATVLGQILPGVSVWDICVSPTKTITFIVVPGNVGDDDTLAAILSAVGHPAATEPISRPALSAPTR